MCFQNRKLILRYSQYHVVNDLLNTLFSIEFCLWNFSLPGPRVYPFTTPEAFPWCRNLLKLATQFPGIATRRLLLNSAQMELGALGELQLQSRVANGRSHASFLSLYHIPTGTLGLAVSTMTVWTGFKQQHSASDDAKSAQRRIEF